MSSYSRCSRSLCRSPHREHTKWLAKNGVTAFVLRYRLGPRYHHPIELGDAQRAIRTLRFHAAQWQLDPARVAFYGLAISIVLGISLAVLMSQAKWVERSIYPYAVALQTVPILAIAPIILPSWNIEAPALMGHAADVTASVQTPASAAVPPATVAYSMAWDEARGQLVLFDIVSVVAPQTWIWTGSNWERKA